MIWTRTSRQPPRTALASSIASVVLVLAVGARTSSAQQTPADEPPPAEPSAPAPPPPEERPWARGVTAKQRDRAMPLFREGNVLFSSSQYAKALAKYRAAIVHWDHPAIRFNMGVCLVNLDRPLEAHEHLTAAMAYGEEPLGPEKFRQAQTYRKLLEGQLSRLEVRCEHPSGVVQLDGETVVECPGSVVRLLAPGPHQLVARRPGFLTQTRALDLTPGRLDREDVTFVRIPTPMRTKRRWSAWKPWAVLGGGVVSTSIGVALMTQARNDRDAVEDRIARGCPNGCAPGDIPEELLAREDRAAQKNAAGIATVSIGAVAIAAGAALVVMNRPRRVAAPRDDDAPPPVQSGGLTVAPYVIDSGAGVIARFTF